MTNDPRLNKESGGREERKIESTKGASAAHVGDTPGLGFTRVHSYLCCAMFNVSEEIRFGLLSLKSKLGRLLRAIVGESGAFFLKGVGGVFG